jgi:plastocyanin
VRPQRQLLLLAAVLGVVAIALPAAAASEAGPPPSVNAVEEPALEPYPGYKYPASFHWSPLETAVTGGATVTFANKSSTVKHGIIWQSGPATPACSGGVPVEVEEGKGATGWSGTCSFARPGTYAFYCSIHGLSMHGTIVVGAGGTTVSMQPPSSGGSPVGASSPNESQAGVPSGSAGPSGSPLAGAASVKLAASQRGSSVHGSLGVSQVGAGGELEVVLLAGGASPARPGHPTQVRVGRLVRSSLHAGTVSFTVPLGAKAKGALRSRRRLSLTVRIRLTPAHGSAVTITRTVLLHA